MWGPKNDKNAIWEPQTTKKGKIKAREKPAIWPPKMTPKSGVLAVKNT